MMDRRSFTRSLGQLLIGAGCTPWPRFARADASSYPDRPVELVIPFGAGGTTDVVGRVVAREIETFWKRTVIVVNKTGATGIVATKYIARSEPDGYRLLVALDSTQVTAALLSRPPLPYDPVADFSPISELVRGGFVLLVHPSLGVSSVSELVDYARAHPGKINAGSAGAGSTPHLLAEMFKIEAGIDLVHVPYLGAAPMNLALRSGEVQIGFVAVPDAIQLLAALPSLKILAATAGKRLPHFPNVPTMAECGYPNVQDETRFGLIGPAGMDQDLIQKINSDLHGALDSDRTRRRLFDLGYVLSLSSSREYAEALTEAVSVKRRIIEAARITTTGS